MSFPRAESLRAVAAALPLEQLLIETDSPYLAPQPHRGERNEPAHVRMVAAELGQFKGLDLEAVGQATSESFLRRFMRARP